MFNECDWKRSLIIVYQFPDADASGRPGSGFLSGNLVWLGSYVQCQNTPGARYCLAPSVMVQITGQVIVSTYFFWVHELLLTACY